MRLRLGDKKMEKKLAGVPPSERVLLISHCLRPSELCEAKMSKKGLQCRDDCPNRCAIGKLRILAQELGYKGVCIAPGGSMALNYIRQKKPKATVAIACRKELQEGMEAIDEMIKNEGFEEMAAIVPVPLSSDGCVDTEVDCKYAERIIRL